MARTPFKTLALVGTCLVSAWAVLPAVAQAQESNVGFGIERDQPAVVVADELIYEEQANRVIARGQVEIYYGARVLRADEIVYDRTTGIVTARGNVFIIQETGEVLAADEAEVSDDLRDGFVRRVSLMLASNARIIAESGSRSEGRYLQVERAVYSPCELCEEDPRRPPLWQIRAASVTHDSETRDVVYHDAYFDFFGIPIAYTPYFRHPDPTVERRSGFLVPVAGSSSQLGPYLRGYYFWDIAPGIDATVELGVTSRAGFVVGLEYRQRFENGLIVLSGSVNQSDYDELIDGSVVTNTDALRGHLFGTIGFDLDENWRVGAEIAVASDDNYLGAFRYSSADVLTNRAYAEGFFGLSYALAEVYAFQDLRPVSVPQAAILPWLSYHYVGEPGDVLGGQVMAEASFVNLNRGREVNTPLLTPTEGVDTRRLSVSGVWQRVDYTPFGLVTEFTASLRGDLYWSDDLPDADNPAVRRDSVFASRIVPRATMVARMPFVRNTETTQQVIEPIVGFTAAPIFGDEDDIPNNDSLDFEFDANNLFRESRYPGIDRVDGGVRVTYGLRGAVYFANGGSLSAFLGQSYQITDRDSYPAGSGLDRPFSNIVGSVSINPIENVDVEWRFSFDSRTMNADRNEVSARLDFSPVLLVANYTYANNYAEIPGSPNTDELSVAARLRLNDYWSLTGSYTYDFDSSATREYSLGLSYLDECFDLDITVERSLTTDRDRSAGTSVFVRLDLLTLGSSRQ